MVNRHRGEGKKVKAKRTQPHRHTCREPAQNRDDKGKWVGIKCMAVGSKKWEESKREYRYRHRWEGSGNDGGRYGEGENTNTGRRRGLVGVGQGEREGKAGWVGEAGEVGREVYRAGGEKPLSCLFLPLPTVTPMPMPSPICLQAWRREEW